MFLLDTQKKSNKFCWKYYTDCHFKLILCRQTSFKILLQPNYIFPRLLYIQKYNRISTWICNTSVIVDWPFFSVKKWTLKNNTPSCLISNIQQFTLWLIKTTIYVYVNRNVNALYLFLRTSWSSSFQLWLSRNLWLSPA